MANPRAEKKGAQRKRKRSEGVPLSRWIPISAPKVIPQVFSSTFTISDCPGILLVGDVMIGRLVNQHLKSAKPEYPWGDTLPLFRGCDVRICNLECVLSDRGRPYGNSGAYPIEKPVLLIAATGQHGLV